MYFFFFFYKEQSKTKKDLYHFENHLDRGKEEKEKENYLDRPWEKMLSRLSLVAILRGSTSSALENNVLPGTVLSLLNYPLIIKFITKAQQFCLCNLSSVLK